MQIDFQGSPHFHRMELACHCGCNEALIEPQLIRALEALRDYVASPVVILDAYRCPRHNLEVGGVPNSQHVKGRAADLVIPSCLSVLGMLSKAEAIPDFNMGGIGLYTGEDDTTPRLHCDVRLDGPARWGVRFGEQQIAIAQAIQAAQALIAGKSKCSI